MDVFLTDFPKKLLVATSVLIIITMCSLPCEARSLEHKIRHERRHEGLSRPTKDMARLRVPEAPVIEKRRPHNKQTISLTETEDESERLQKNLITRFKNATTKIRKKLINTKRYFTADKKKLNGTRDFNPLSIDNARLYRDGMPAWLPTTNFVDIHFHNFRNPRKSALPKIERKFTYLMSKLYKSLMEFKEIFERLSIMQAKFPDEPFCIYNETRNVFIQKILNRLTSTIAELKENMAYVDMAVPEYTPNSKLDLIELQADVSQYLKNDYITFRAYGNILKNWNLEFQCQRERKASTNKACRIYEETLQKKLDMRKQRGRRLPSS